MCRFVLYLGRETSLDVLITRPTNSIIHQSFHSRLRKVPLNGDGFGVAWYGSDVSPEPAQFRSIQPARNDVNLLQLARVCRKSTVLAHVRAATPGSGVSQANCHPFTAERFAFMHNGVVAKFARLKRTLAARLSDTAYSHILGTTDSEHLFGLFCDHHSQVEAPDETETMAAALNATITDVAALASEIEPQRVSHLNLAVQTVLARLSHAIRPTRRAPACTHLRATNAFVNPECAG